MPWHHDEWFAPHAIDLEHVGYVPVSFQYPVMTDKRTVWL